jgi:hypothetical protein
MTLPVIAGAAWTLDGLSFNTGPDANGFSYLVSKSVGWSGSAPARPDLTDRPSSNGAYRASNYRGSRVVELEGVAECAEWTDRDALIDSLNGLCADPDTLYPLVRTERTRTLSLLVELLGKVDVIEHPDGFSVDFTIQVVASEPRRFSTEVKSASTQIAQAALLGVAWDGPAIPITGIEWDGNAIPVTGMVWQASSGVSGFIDLDNAGTAPTPVLFTITAPSSGTLIMPTITDTRGNVLTYNGTMAPGDVLTIDTATGSCLLNNYSVGGLFSRSDFFEIPPHTTLSVQFSASGPADTAQLLAQWQDAY